MNTFRQQFNRDAHKAEYIKMFGASAYRVYWDSHFQQYLDAEFPAGGNRELSRRECRILANTYIGIGRDPQDIPAILAQGERQSRWIVPVTEGILTAEYWTR